MDQFMIDLPITTEDRVVVPFPVRPHAKSMAQARTGLPARIRQGVDFGDTLATITNSFREIDATRAEIRQHAGELGRNLEEFNLALEDLERARDKVNLACAEALEEAGRAKRMRLWVERSARAMESGDIAEMERLRAEEGDF
jgi:hypothetical protein